MSGYMLREIDHDTVHVLHGGRVWLVFTCDTELAKRDQRCWGCCVRDPGVTTSARDFLRQAWPHLMEWPGGVVPELRDEGAN